MNNSLIEKYGLSARWVNWKLETRKGKTTKLPYQINSKLASSTNPETWSTYDEVRKISDKTGIVLHDKKLICVDIDHVVEDGVITHELKEEIESFINSVNSYVELSQSNTGLHIFFEVDESFELKANRRGIYEIYNSGRYIAVTGNGFMENLPVRTVSVDEAITLLNIIGYPWAKEESPTEQKTFHHTTLDDSKVLEKMFNSKNGAKIKALYNGDTSENNNDESSADLSLCGTLAFWTGKDYSQIERIWTSSPLGQRKKTQTREDYRTRTINAAMSSCKEVYKSHTMRVEEVGIDLLYVLNKEKEKVFIMNTENMCRILRGHEDFRNRLRYDSFKNIYEINDGKWRIIEVNDAVNIQTEISMLYLCFAKVGKDMIYDSMIKVAKENTIDSAKDYIKSIIWDNVPRLDSWLSKVYGVKDNEYHRAVASNWVKGLVKRIVAPGCKFDYVLVLEGEQGVKKSTSLGVLGGDWHVETTMSTDSKDFFMQFQGKAIIEFSEGETLSRTEVKRMKAIITMQVDKYRPPYERSSQDFPRRCVFAMTTNQNEYLKDETGNRRWLPVTVIKDEADIEWLQENRDQIFAEAYHRVFNLHETIYEFPKEVTKAEQNARRIKDENADLVYDWYYHKLIQTDRENGITVHQVYRDALNGGYPSKMLDKYHEMKITDILKTNLGLEKRRASDDGSQVMRWFNPKQAQEVKMESIDEILANF